MAPAYFEITYEPIDFRTLSKREKVQYLLTATRKPRLDQQTQIHTPSIAIYSDNNTASSSSTTSDSDSDSSPPGAVVVLPKRKREPPNAARVERMEAELRKLDEFWSFKPIPREVVPLRMMR